LTVHAICRAASDSLHSGRLSRLIRLRYNYLVASGNLQTHVSPGPGHPEFSRSFMLCPCQVQGCLPASYLPQQDPGTVESLATVTTQCRPAWFQVVAKPSKEASNKQPRSSVAERLIAGLPVSSNAGPSGAQRALVHTAVLPVGERGEYVRGWPTPPNPQLSPTLPCTPRNAGMMR
jgi:hypothetical protein